MPIILVGSVWPRQHFFSMNSFFKGIIEEASVLSKQRDLGMKVGMKGACPIFLGFFMAVDSRSRPLLYSRNEFK